MLKARRDLGSRIGKQIAQSTLHAPYAALVQIAGDPVYLPAGLLNDHTKRTLRVVRSRLMNHGIGHECALCNKSRNCWASPPPLTKKLLGSCSSGSSTGNALLPWAHKRCAICLAACCPLPLRSESKARYTTRATPSHNW